jgi:PAS domain S-box-containing protein
MKKSVQDSVFLIEKIKILQTKLSALEKERDKFKFIVENTKDNISIITFDLKAKILYVSPSEKLSTGHEPEELLGRSFFDFVHPDDKKKLLPLLAKYIKLILKKNLTQDNPTISEIVEFRFIAKQGGWRNIRSTVKFIGKNMLTISRDITVQKQVGNALIDTEKKFSNLIRNIPDVIWTTDINSKTTYVSPNVKNIIGFSDTEIHEDLKYKWNERIHPADQKAVASAFQELFSKGTKFDIEFRYQRKDGKWIWLHDRSIAVYEKDGILYADGMFSDITTRKQAETEILKSKNQLSVVFNNSNDLQLLVKYEGHKTFRLAAVNAIYLKTLNKFGVNIAEADLIGFTIQEAMLNLLQLDQEIIEETLNKYQKVAKTCQKIRVNESIEILGKHYYSEETLAPICNAEQECEYILYSAHDITERKLADAKLKESQEKYKALFETAQDAIFIADADTGIIIDFNDKATEMTGYCRNKLIGKHQSFLHPEKSQSTARESFLTAVNNKGLLANEVDIQHKNGKLIPVEISSGGRTQLSDKAIHIGMFRDISKRKQTAEVQQTLFDISNAVNITNNLHELYYSIHHLLKSVIDVTNFYISLYNEEQDSMTFPYYIDEKDDNPDPVPMDQSTGLTNYVFSTGKPLLANNEVEDKLLAEGSVKITGASAKIWLGVPLKIEKKVIGIIAVQSYTDSHRYSEKDIEILSFVSEEIALAIHRKHSEEQIIKDLNEKNVLLKELYHRTKNNMQVISSMLRIQSRNLEVKIDLHKTAKECIQNVFGEVINKINAMSLVHQKLYQANDLSRINLKEYIHDLLKLLMQSYSVQDENVKLKLDLQDVFVLIDSAVPLGLILNELISNALKYAFPNSKQGELWVRLYKDEIGFINVHVEDNGIGVPEDFDINNIDTMGIQTVMTLIKYQLKGQIRIDKDNGLKWHFRFKDNLHKKRV